MTALLDIRHLTRAFDGLLAVSDVSFSIAGGQITALIGPNGAGKSTLLNLVSGTLPPTGGVITYQGQVISGCPPHRIAEYGIARTFQHVELFMNMTAAENVMVGRHLRSRGTLFSAMFRLFGTAAEERRVREDALRFLERVGLREDADTPASALPFGRQRLLEIARALATEPKLLLLDEAASGLSTREKRELVSLIYAIRDAGVTIFMVDHDMDLVMSISDAVVVLDHGEKIAEGTPTAVQHDARVIAAYLGEEAAHA
ncbi:MAG TPA: ABC transporter ATP-binding protein [Armatimonadota bacterium]|nr:ABC transporter ATP-binding protein [Armatimonadota bacterium]HOS42513.1 ABC transporter ATP-binding protein [Armatimonadota bacterium]